MQSVKLKKEKERILSYEDRFENLFFDDWEKYLEILSIKRIDLKLKEIRDSKRNLTLTTFLQQSIKPRIYKSRF